MAEQLFVGFEGVEKRYLKAETFAMDSGSRLLSLYFPGDWKITFHEERVKPIGVHANSTGSLASSWAWARIMSIQDICLAVGWSLQNTFAKFYKLQIPFALHVLSATGVT